MPPFPMWRMALLALIIAFITGLAFYALTPDREDKPCPPEKPVLVEDFSCVPTSFFETTFVPREGQK